VSHQFKIRNHSSKTWRFQRFHVSCACTVGQASAPAIPPGKAEYVDVILTAPAGQGDETRRVGVQFTEDEAPFLWLEVSARVRDPVTLLPPRLALNRIGLGRTVESTFEIHNYEDQDIQITAIKASEPWIKIKSQAAFRGGPKPDPRQVWRVVVQAATEGLAPGPHRAELLIRTSGAQAPPKPLAIELTIAAPVEAIPARLFFGAVERGRPTQSRVLLRVSSDVTLSSLDSIRLQHDLGDQLRLNCSAGSSKDYWELAAVLTPGHEASSILRGTIEVRFDEGGLPPLIIPVLARVPEP
jgi:hypothetical protein